MANISNEIRAFQNAVYGEEVRSSMISAIQKINTVTENCETTVNSFSSNISSATTAANNAASNANTAATNANNAATAANTAKNAANTAASNANAAVTSANNAASNASAAATSANNAEEARVTAENARANAESTRQANESARQSAEQARVSAETTRANSESARDSAESVRQTNEITRQGNERQRQNSETLRENAESSRASGFSDMQAAFADMQRTVIPQATESTMGGVIVGDGLNVDNALLSLAVTKSGSGTAVTSNGAVLESVVVYGQSDQEGTPTPSEPVPIEVVSGLSMPSNIAWRQGSVSTSTGAEESDANRMHTAMFEILPGADYIVGVTNSAFNYSVRLFRSNTFTASSFVYGDSAWKSAAETYNNQDAKFMCVVIRRTDNSNITPSNGAEVGLYANTDCIGLQVNDTITPIDLQSNVLASLPDGTRDTVTVDGAGHCVLTKNVGKTTIDGNIQGSTSFTDSSTMGGNCTRITMNMSNFPAMKSAALNATNSYMSIAVAGATSASAAPYPGFYSKTATSGVYLTLPSTLTSASDVAAWLTANNFDFFYPLAEATTIDLGYIDMPTIPEDATISVSASMTPVIDAAWWERGAEAIARTVKALSERIKALEEAVAELATA